MLILSRNDVEGLLEPQELLAGLEQGFKSLSADLLNVPSRNQAIAPKGVLVGMPAYMPDRYMAVKLVSVFHENHLRNIPNHQAVIALFDPETGSPVAFMDGEYITALRTAAAAVLSIKLLARKNIHTAAIIGAGVLGESHLKMILALGGTEKIWIAARQNSKARALSSRAAVAAPADSVRHAVADADVVCLCTSSAEPVIKAEWLKQGAHITSVGYRPPGGELPRDLIESSRLFVESRAAFSQPPVGCSELQGLDAGFGTELGEVLLNQRPGRKSEQETTIYKSMGHAMEDLVAANLVYQGAVKRGIGTRFDL